MLDLIIITVILIFVTLLLLYQMAFMPVKTIVLVILFSLMAIPLYNKCQCLRKKPIQRTFWRSYWYDMQCKLVMIPYGIGLAGFIVWIS